MSEYSEVTSKINATKNQMKQREDQAFVIADSNSAIFVPVTLIDSVMQDKTD